MRRRTRNCNRLRRMVYRGPVNGRFPMAPMSAGKWTITGTSAAAEALLRASAGAAGARAGGETAELVVCPPVTQIGAAVRLLGGAGVSVGGQDCHQADRGAHTGDISAAMLADLGATHVILGHSERRQNHGELDETVREKVLAARRHDLVPIVCVGETLDQRGGGEETEVVGWQIKGSLPDGFADHPGVVAYEPVWAIGTGKTATADDVRTMHAFIREELRRQFGDAGAEVRILYGGSVKPGNAAALLGVPEVGGALVGGASLVADEFLAIWRAAH